MYNGIDSAVTLINCLFSGNSAPNTIAGGVTNRGNVATIINCVFANNTSVSGGGMFNEMNAVVTLSNSVLWNNSDAGGMDETAQIDGDGTEALNVDYCLIKGLTGGLGGIGNIGVDPRFVDALGPDGVAGTLDDDLRVQAGSPAIDAADNLAVPPDTLDLDGDGDTSEPIPIDLDGLERFQDDPEMPDTGNGVGPIVDMGPYERLGFLDCNGNGIPDDEDIASGFSQDCNNNGIPDECDISGGTSRDCDDNGVPDECQAVGGCELSVWTGLGDGINWSDPNNWCPMVVPNNNGTDYTVLVGPGASITLDIDVTICGLDLDPSSTINADAGVGRTLTIETPDGLTTRGTINIQNNNNRVQAGGLIANDGVINIIATNGTAELVPAAAGTTLSGTGEVRMFNPDTSRLGSTDAARSLTNDDNHLIRGTGQVVGNFINDGVVTADDPGGNPLTLSGPAGTVRTNNSLMQTQGGGALRIGGELNQGAGGVLSSDASGSVVRIGDSGLPETVLSGGTIQQGAGEVILGNRARIKDLTIEGGLTVPSLLDFAFVEGQITNNGRLVLNPTQAPNATLATFTTEGPNSGAVQFDGNGTIEMRNDTRAVLDSLGPFFPTITNGADHTIEGIGIIRANLINDGRIVARLVGPGSTLSIQSATGRAQKVNNGTLEATGFATLDIQADIQNDGTILASENGIVQVLANISGSGEARATGGRIIIRQMTVFRIRSIIVEPGSPSFMDVDNAIVGADDMSITGGTVTITAGAALTVANTLVMCPDTVRDPDAVAILEVFNSTVTAATLDMCDDAVLRGNGTVNGQVLNNGGAVEPGGSAGELTLGDSYTQESAARLIIELGGLLQGDEYDHLIVQQTATLDGSLEVTTINGFVPQANDTFQIISAGAVIGEFALVEVSGFPPDLGVDVTYGATSVTLRVIDTSCDPCDMNCDGTVNASDIEFFIDILFNGATPCDTCTADTNGDGRIDAGDIEGFIDCLFP